MMGTFSLEQITETRDCDGCGRPFESRVAIMAGRRVFGTVRCESCLEANEEPEATPKIRRLTKWERLCPTGYRNVDESRFPARALESCMAWDPKSGRGLLIRGDSGTGKTTLLWHLLRALPEPWECFDHIGLSMRIADCQRSEEPERELINISSLPLLCIDDLGQAKLTERVEEGLYYLLERRTRERLPTIITTQFVGKDLAKRFSVEDRAEATIRRIRDFFDQVVMKKTT